MTYSRHVGSTLESFLEEEGDLAEFRTVAIKEVIAWQIAEQMRLRKLSKKKMAELMHTSRTQIDRLLNPTDGNVTIETIQRAAAVVGCRINLDLVAN